MKKIIMVFLIASSSMLAGTWDITEYLPIKFGMDKKKIAKVMKPIIQDELIELVEYEDDLETFFCIANLDNRIILCDSLRDKEYFYVLDFSLKKGSISKIKVTIQPISNGVSMGNLFNSFKARLTTDYKTISDSTYESSYVSIDKKKEVELSFDVKEDKITIIQKKKK